MPNKKGQISDTMNWIIATIIIVVVLMLFVYASSVLSKTKVVSYKGPETKVDLLETKTSLAFLINDDNKNKIEQWIKDEK